MYSNGWAWILLNDLSFRALYSLCIQLRAKSLPVIDDPTTPCGSCSKRTFLVSMPKSVCLWLLLRITRTHNPTKHGDGWEAEKAALSLNSLSEYVSIDNACVNRRKYFKCWESWLHFVVAIRPWHSPSVLRNANVQVALARSAMSNVTKTVLPRWSRHVPSVVLIPRAVY